MPRTASRPLTYLYTAPAGVVPCPTLAAVIGAVLLIVCWSARSAAGLDDRRHATCIR